MINRQYFNQVSLLVKILPYIAKETCFALKGRTAINLFYQNLQRLSVDIDLTYINFDSRNEAYININSALERINNKLQKSGYKSFLRGENEKKILCTDNNFVTVKIEPNYTSRGYINKPEIIPICTEADEKFGYTENLILSKEETYGGKICAALDRQHPRDLFDICQIIQNNELTSDIIKGFVVMLLSAKRPLYEILNPNIADKTTVYNSEFYGMTDIEFTYEQHIETLKYLINYLQDTMKKEYKEFLLDFVSLKTNLIESGIENLEKFPAVKWKLHNLEKLKESNFEKFEKEYSELKKILD